MGNAQAIEVAFGGDLPLGVQILSQISILA